MSSTPFDAKNRDEALAKYKELSSSTDPHSKLLALGGLVHFLADVDTSFLQQCAEATDYLFLERLIRNDIRLHSELKEDPGNLVQLGCAVLGVFAKVEGMKEKDEVLDRIPALVLAFERMNEATRTDILESLQAFATVQKGADLILNPSSTSTFLRTIEKPTYHQNIFRLLTLSLQHASSTTNAAPALELLAEIFAKTKDPNLIYNLLSFFTTQYDTVKPPHNLLIPLYHGIKHLMLSKLDENTRTQALILLSQILIHLGPTFLFSPSPSEDRAKQLALITIRLASVDYQTQSETTTDKTRTIASLNILYITIAWLLSQSNDDTDIKIGAETLSPDEILSIQESLSAAVSKASLFLRTRYDQLLSSGEVVSGEVIDLVVRTSVKVVGAWLMEGSIENDELGLLEVFFALCLIGDVEMTTWAMRGIRGMIMFTEDGETELMAHKEQFPKLLDEIVGTISSNEDEVLNMVKEICIVFRILVQNQPLMMTQRSVQNLPARLLDAFEVSGEEVKCAAQTEASLLALEILSNLAEDADSLKTGLLRSLVVKWLARGRDLVWKQRGEDAKEALIEMVSSLEAFSL